MQKNSIIVLCAILAVIIDVQHVAGQCNQCLQNKIACISSTSFRFCDDNGVINMDVAPITCPSGNFCTQLTQACQPSAAAAACNNAVVSKCRTCVANQLFTCTGRDTFAMCQGTTVTTVTGTCPAGRVCDSSQTNPCVPLCDAPSPLDCA